MLLAPARRSAPAPAAVATHRKPAHTYSKQAHSKQQARRHAVVRKNRFLARPAACPSVCLSAYAAPAIGPPVAARGAPARPEHAIPRVDGEQQAHDVNCVSRSPTSDGAGQTCYPSAHSGRRGLADHQARSALARGRELVWRKRVSIQQISTQHEGSKA